jgi:hypothetical protein
MSIANPNRAKPIEASQNGMAKTNPFTKVQLS